MDAHAGHFRSIKPYTVNPQIGTSPQAPMGKKFKRNAPPLE